MCDSHVLLPEGPFVPRVEFGRYHRSDLTWMMQWLEPNKVTVSVWDGDQMVDELETDVLYRAGVWLEGYGKWF